MTPRALRHYESLGLVSAARPNGSARAYDDGAMARLELIVALRAADLPLGAIDAILGAGSDGAGQHRRAVRALESALGRARQAVERLETAHRAAQEGLGGLRRLACGGAQA